ncbi:hypothetical protein E4H04_10880 [Candidatus Bathyarchaeota archaeon]|nr:MAG: hypothetical protein E4H04_10880 [Candidatus Bathyarchaeota archaeon]
MSSVLEQVEWGKPVLSFLHQIKQIDPKVPALIHIRHSERDLGKLHTDLTQIGLKASVQFGKQLPKNRAYRFYHTPYSRTEKTVKKIIEGLRENQSQTSIQKIEISTMRDEEKAFINLRKNWDDRTQIRSWFYKWAAGHYPPWEMNSTLDAAQQLAGLMVKNLDTASSDVIDIYVTHDTYVAVCIFHWFGLMIDNWINFLDGYLVQFYSDYMRVFFNEITMDIEYPYWWNFTK